ncbi:ankyrin repeat-containing domain protein [Biscogniauxia marginata]|nr:ankyrin repeat-containing domain protein [Biscogniauxia marginata]
MAPPQTPSRQQPSFMSPLDRLNPNVDLGDPKDAATSPGEAMQVDSESATLISILGRDQANSVCDAPQSTGTTTYAGLTLATPSPVDTNQRLPDDLIWYLARNFIEHPRDLAYVSYTCRRLYDLLDYTRYRCDAEFVKIRELEAMQPGHHPPRMYITHKNTALGSACISKNIIMARKAIRAALSVFPGYLDSRIAFQGPPLSIAIRNGNLDLVRELLEAGSCPDPIIKHKSHYSKTHRRISQEVEKPVRIMEGAYLLPSFYGFAHLRLNALGFYIWYCEPSCVTELLALRTNELFQTVPTLDITSPLHIASLSKLTHVVRILLTRGYAKGVRSRYFRSAGPLHLAAATEDNQEILGLLLDHGEDLMMRDKDGETALAWADKHKCFKNAQYLLEASKRRT